MPEKPWKTKKPVAKKEVTIEMFVPTSKPRPEPKIEEDTGIASDFKVSIFVAKKPEID